MPSASLQDDGRVPVLLFSPLSSVDLLAVVLFIALVSVSLSFAIFD
jgi:hypothetical protein